MKFDAEKVGRFVAALEDFAVTSAAEHRLSGADVTAALCMVAGSMSYQFHSSVDVGAQFGMKIFTYQLNHMSEKEGYPPLFEFREEPTSRPSRSDPDVH